MADTCKNHANYLSMQIIQAYFTLNNITLRRVVSQTIMRIIREVRISEGQIIRATLYWQQVQLTQIAAVASSAGVK